MPGRQWLLLVVLLACAALPAAAESAGPDVAQAPPAIATALTPSGGISPDWELVQIRKADVGFEAIFRQKADGAFVHLSVVPPWVDVGTGPKSSRYGIRVPASSSLDVRTLAQNVAKALDAVSISWDQPLPPPPKQLDEPPPPPPTPQTPATGENWVIPAGHERQVQEFLRPLSMGKVIVDKQALDSIEIREGKISLHFVHLATGDKSIIDVLPPNRKDGEPAGPIRLKAAGPVPPALFVAVKNNFATVQRSALPWSKPTYSDELVPVTGRQAWSSLSGERAPLLRLSLLLVLLLVVTTGYLLFKAWREAPPPPAVVASLLGLTGLALVLRWTVSPWTFLHEYYHVADHVQFYLFGGSEIRFYGSTGPALYRLANELFGTEERAIFATNALLASLTVPALALLDFALFRQWPRALLAGLILCLLPVHLRFSSSEELAIPEVLFAVWGLAALVRYCATRELPAILAAAAALALAGNARPEGMLIPVIALAYVFVSRPPREWTILIEPRTLLGGAILGGILLARLHAMPHGAVDSGSILPHADPASLRGNLHLVAFLDAGVTPRGLWLLLLLGLAGAVVFRRIALHAWLLLSAVTYAVILLTLFKNPPPSNLRTQLITMPFLVLICAGAWPVCVRWLKDRRAARWGLAATVAVMALVGVVTRLPMLRATGDAQQEWMFLRDSIARLPDGPGDLLTLTGGDMSGIGLKGHGKIDTFPRFLLSRTQSQLNLLDIDTLAASGKWPEPHNGLLFYQGMYCYFYFADFEQPANSMHHRCQEVRNRYELKPLVTRSIPGPGYSPLGYTAPPYEIGFFKVVGLKKQDGATTTANTHP